MTDNNLMDNMWEIFKIRVEALQNINPKMFVDNQKPVSFLSNLEKDGPKDALIKASLVAQAYITTKKPQLSDKFDHAYSEALVDRNIHADINRFLIPSLVNAYLQDKQNGIIDENGKLTGNLKKSKIMQIPHNDSQYGIPAQARDVINKYSNTSKLAELRSKIAQTADKCLNTNLEKKKLPKTLKNIETIISDNLFDR